MQPPEYSPLELTAVHAIACKSSFHRRGYDTGSGSTETSVSSQAAYAHSPKKNYQTPLLNRMYFCRCLAIKSVLAKAFVSIKGESVGSRTQLLVLGAGFEMYTFVPHDIDIFLVDLPTIISARKAVDEDRPHVHLVAADLRNTSQLMHNLVQSAFNVGFPTVILIESVLSYLDSGCVNTLLRHLNQSIAWATVIIYDVLLPEGSGGFSQYTEKCFERGKTALLSAHKSTHDMKRNMHENSWPFACCFSVEHMLNLFSRPEELTIPMSIEPFDEFASLALLNQHYVVCWAGNNEKQFKNILNGK